MENIQNLPALSNKVSKSDKAFSQESVQKLYEGIDNIMEKAYVMYHIETGLRVSDVVNTELVHVMWQENRTYTYDHKKDTWRYVYWPEKVKSVLKMWLKQRQAEDIKDKRLFPFSEKTANRILKRWALKLNIANSRLVSSHWCRHTFIRLSRKAGRDIKAVQQNTGDTVKTILDWYSDLSSDDMREQVEGKPLI